MKETDDDDLEERSTPEPAARAFSMTKWNVALFRHEVAFGLNGARRIQQPYLKLFNWGSLCHELVRLSDAERRRKCTPVRSDARFMQMMHHRDVSIMRDRIRRLVKDACLSNNCISNC